MKCNSFKVLTIDACQKILNKKERKYSVEQARQVRELLYQLANIEFSSYQIGKNEKRNSLHQSIDRGTS